MSPFKNVNNAIINSSVLTSFKTATKKNDYVMNNNYRLM